MKRILGLVLILLLSGCSTRYLVKDDAVDFVYRINFGLEKRIIRVNGADVDTFQALSGWFAKDKNQVYWQGRRLRYADPLSISVLNNYFAIDHSRVFGHGTTLLGANPDSFELLQGGWSRDGENYFYGTRTVPVCDYESFRIIDEFTPFRAIDEKCYYWQRQIVQIENFATLEILPGGYAVDESAVYFAERKIPEADVQSFEVKGDRFLSIAKDNQRCFLGPRIVDCNELEDRQARDFCGCDH